MSRRERLQENYEDALFALLVEDMLEAEGERLLRESERLRDVPGCTASPEADRRCLETIRRAFAKRRRQAVGRTVRKVLDRVAMVVVACALGFTVIYAASPNLRVKTLNLLIGISDVSASLSLTDKDKEQGGVDEGGVQLGYQLPPLPEDFQLAPKVSGANRRAVWAQ